jgi:hypothetical protein
MVSPLVSIVAGSPAIIVTPELLVDQVTPALISTGPEIPETTVVAVAVASAPTVTLDGSNVMVKFVPFCTQTVAEAVALIP